MNESQQMAPEFKQLLVAMLFAARQPVPTVEIRRILHEVAENDAANGRPFAQISENDIRTTLEQINADLLQSRFGLRLVEVAGGFRFQTDPECGPWLRHLLEMDKPARLTRPTLETLAIIAYRQPVTRAEIESVRGVAVDAIVRNLLELQLIRVVGRSALPGRPLLLGTTQRFLEHFGLKDIKDLPGIEQLCRREDEYQHQIQEATAETENVASQTGGPASGNEAWSDNAIEQISEAGDPPSEAAMDSDAQHKDG